MSTKNQNILALDIATNTGWKTATASGTWNFSPNRGESDGIRLVRFKAKCREMINMEGITLVAYERAAGFHKNALIVESEMIGVMKELCYELKINLACYSATQIKKDATGKGNANKDAMIEAAVKLGYNPKTSDEADAIHIYLLAMKDLN